MQASRFHQITVLQLFVLLIQKGDTQESIVFRRRRNKLLNKKSATCHKKSQFLPFGGTFSHFCAHFLFDMKSNQRGVKILFYWISRIKPDSIFSFLKSVKCGLISESIVISVRNTCITKGIGNLDIPRTPIIHLLFLKNILFEFELFAQQSWLLMHLFSDF